MNISQATTHTQQPVLEVPGLDLRESTTIGSSRSGALPPIGDPWTSQNNPIATIEKLGKLGQKASRTIDQGIAATPEASSRDRDDGKTKVSVSLDILWNQKGFKNKGSDYIDRAHKLISDIFGKGTSSRTLNSMILAMPANPDQVLINLEEIRDLSPIVEPRL